MVASLEDSSSKRLVLIAIEMGSIKRWVKKSGEAWKCRGLKILSLLLRVLTTLIVKMGSVGLRLLGLAYHGSGGEVEANVTGGVSDQISNLR